MTNPYIFFRVKVILKVMCHSQRARVCLLGVVAMILLLQTCPTAAAPLIRKPNSLGLPKLARSGGLEGPLQVAPQCRVHSRPLLPPPFLPAGPRDQAQKEFRRKITFAHPDRIMLGMHNAKGKWIEYRICHNVIS